ncbi:MAG: hypothetical protein PHE53_12400 [Thermoguttaceae bacterium]|nr:hypothetical protein [Thermoguttaceae bacterium]
MNLAIPLAICVLLLCFPRPMDPKSEWGTYLFAWYQMATGTKPKTAFPKGAVLIVNGLKWCRYALILLTIVWIVREVSHPPIPDEEETNVTDAFLQIERPTSDLRRLVEPIRDLKINAEDREKIACFFVAFADTLEHHGEALARSSTVRTVNTNAGGMFFEKSLDDQYAQLPTEIDSIIGESLNLKQSPEGWEERELTERDRQRLSEAFRAVAWAALGGGA